MEISGKKRRDIPYGIGVILCEMFRKFNVEVHYSIIDNDDTISYYANYHRCIVLSHDKDFWRYSPRKFIIF